MNGVAISIQALWFGNPCHTTKTMYHYEVSSTI